MYTRTGRISIVVLYREVRNELLIIVDSCQSQVGLYEMGSRTVRADEGRWTSRSRWSWRAVQAIARSAVALDGCPGLMLTLQPGLTITT